MANTTNNNITYAKKLQQPTQTNHPNKDQAIVLNAKNEINLQEYIYEIGKIINPKNILYASRISNSRICIYLASKTQVDLLVSEHPTIYISNHKIDVRRLVSPTRKIIISNVHPTIPNSIIEEKIKQLGMKPASPINFIRIGMKETAYSHILSFRRLIFITENENTPQITPESIEVEYENTNYRLFLSTETANCTICKKNGHSAQQCHFKNQEITNLNETHTTNTQSKKDIIQPQILQINKQKQIYNTTQNTKEHTLITTVAEVHPPQNINSPSPQINNKTIEKNSHIEQISKNATQQQATPANISIESIHKRTRKESSSTSSAEEIRTQEDKEETIEKNNEDKEKKLKKPKKSPPNTDQLKNEITNNPNKYIISYDNFTEFLENSSATKDKLNLSRQYTEDTHQLIAMMDNLYPLLHDRTIKHKYTTLKTKLKLQLLEEIEKSSYQDTD